MSTLDCDWSRALSVPRGVPESNSSIFLSSTSFFAVAAPPVTSLPRGLCFFTEIYIFAFFYCCSSLSSSLSFTCNTAVIYSYSLKVSCASRDLSSKPILHLRDRSGIATSKSPKVTAEIERTKFSIASNYIYHGLIIDYSPFYMLRRRVERRRLKFLIPLCQAS